MFKSFLAFTLIAFTLNASADASIIRILKPTEIKELLGPFPAKGSGADLADHATILKYQLKRSKKDCESAKGFEKFSIEGFFAAQNGPLTEAEANKFSLRIWKAIGESFTNIMTAKGLYNRPRPYLVNPLIVPCISKESTSAYPSGHAALARVLALALAKIYPEREQALMERADLIAESRVLGGVHHPTDIAAGKKLADELMDEALMNPAFLETLLAP